jgi:propanol-preferring alcohol dehydrogenase
MKKTMKAMAITACAPLDPKKAPLEELELPLPCPRDNEILIQVTYCGVCHTELDEIEGRTPPAVLPMVPGHQVTGIVVERGKNAGRFRPGERIGAGWIHSACGACEFCLSHRENLCPAFRARGRDVYGGYAEYMAAAEDYVVRLPDGLPDAEAAPLLCAGAVGFRALRRSGVKDGDILGLSGFGASAHLVLQTARFLFPGIRVFVFARSPAQRGFALSLGAAWAGDFTDPPPEPLHAVIDTTPVWAPLVHLGPRLSPGGRFVINAIRKESLDNDLLGTISYEKNLWLEKTVTSVANVTQRDIEEFISLAARIPLAPEITMYPLSQANLALLELKKGDQKGAKVLVMK